MRVRTSIGEMWLEDGLLWHRIDDRVVSVDAAQEIEAAIRELTGGRPTPAIVDIRSIGYAGPEVRSLFADLPNDTGEIATALIVNSTSSRTMASMFTRHASPNRPIRVFSSPGEAVAWALSQLPPSEPEQPGPRD